MELEDFESILRLSLIEFERTFKKVSERQKRKFDHLKGNQPKPKPLWSDMDFRDSIVVNLW